VHIRRTAATLQLDIRYLTVASIDMSVLWDVTASVLLKDYHHSRGTWKVHRLGRVALFS